MNAPHPRRWGEGTEVDRAGHDRLHATALIGRSSATAAYVAGRERVLGRRAWLHDDPAIAARQLIDARGRLAAAAWARDVLTEVARHGF